MILCSCLIFSALLLKISDAEESYKSVDSLVGQSVELPCNTTAENSDKLNVLAWYKDGSSTAFFSWDPHEPEVASLSGRYKLIFVEDNPTVSHLRVLKVRPSDAGRYHCFADFSSSPTLRTYVQLNVIEPPQKLWVIHENGTHVATTSSGMNTSKNIGPYYVGEQIHLFCVVFGGKPLPSLSWWDEERQLKNTSTPLSSMRARSDLHFGPLRKEHHGKVLSCYAANFDEAPALAISVVIDMFLPPELISVRVSTGEGSGRVRAGEALAAQCRVLGARPQPTIAWHLAGDVIHAASNVTTEPSQRLVMSDIEVCITPDHDETLLTCCVPSNSKVADEIVCAQGIPLTVLYAPELKIMPQQGEMRNNTVSVVKGTNLTLNCTHRSNPSVYKLVWFHGEDIFNAANDEDVQEIIELKNISSKDTGEYACAATNDVGSEYSQPIVVDVTYPPYCEDETVAEYGVSEGESVNISCSVRGNPPPGLYRWVFVNEATNATILKTNHSHAVIENQDSAILYQRPNGTNFSTIFCWGLNNVSSPNLPATPCTFLITDQTVPRPPTQCNAVKSNLDITVSCKKAHDGGLAQKFKFIVKSKDEELTLITNVEPEFIVQEPKTEEYKFVIVAYNEKGESKAIEIDKDNIVNKNTVSAVTNITTLSLALCGGVALVALAACGLVLCARDRGNSTTTREPPLCAYTTDESNCETFNDSDDSECPVRRTESFRRAVARPPRALDVTAPRDVTRNYDVGRSSSFHSARYLNEIAPDKCEVRRAGKCRVHSLQNISRRRDMDALCDHLVMHLPPDDSYSVPKPMNTFYTLPKKLRPRPKEISDEVSEITQASDGYSLPPPPDEFSSYRAGPKIKDVPTKPTSAYSTIRKKPSAKEPNKEPYSNVIISPLNTVGLPTISGEPTLYSYPDERQGTQKSGGILTTFQSHSSPRESGI